ncbi:helix-turn-helix domain-containing protein [Clostridium botulinum]|uniref:helix-turn-helix domain-containing protein n=1 Tax=Clostridium botulinum TaxID=1491 RepID=UPI00077476C6|nr:helix-turn-helix transcriptional regulator [Clostridium botulinum]
MFGENLREWRKKRNLTQSKLGEMVGVTGAYIQQLELGRKNNPSLEIVMKLCDVLKIVPFDLDHDFSENEMYQYLINESTRKERITYLKKLHQENPNDKKISSIYKKFNFTGILSDEDIKIIDSYKEAEEHKKEIRKANEHKNKNTAKISNLILEDALLYNFILSTLEAKNYDVKIDKIVKSLNLDNINQLAVIVLQNTKNYLRSTVNTNINELEESPKDLSFKKNALDSYIENYNDYISIDIKAMTLLESPEK